MELNNLIKFINKKKKNKERTQQTKTKTKKNRRIKDMPNKEIKNATLFRSKTR